MTTEESVSGQPPATTPIPAIELCCYPVSVVYCGECSMPIEYCEYSGKFDKCQQWLEQNLPELAVKQIKIGGDGGATAAAVPAAADGGGGEDADSKKHQGLIRAKLVGAMQSKSDVVVFLDSHCEASDGWLEPMLARIKEKRSAIVCPSIDHIDAETLSYSGGPELGSVGGFWWSLHFRWDRIPERIIRARKSKTDAIPSPTMAGGLLAADRKYFLEVGGYDPGMDIWGGENLEISFRVWMCGGSIEFVPCSHVGHIFRAGHPYNMTGPGGNKDVHGTNSKRLAEVWMDDYKRLYYLHRSDLKDKDVGDLGERKALRRKLKCKSFKWYLDNVIPEKFVPNENVLGYGALRNPESQLCLDTLQKDESGTIPLSLFQCQGGGSSAQMFSWTRDGVVRREVSCAVVGPNNKVQMGTCAEESDANKQQQKWEFTKDGLVKNLGAGLCLDTAGTNNGDQLALANCDPNKGTQKWEFAYTNRK
uniref:Polypeptide N-acetylgalactosaminyltransferase n=1 Tax=Globodera pallida TaxID=36090 RepID=A0A183C4D7_GLOPA